MGNYLQAYAEVMNIEGGWSNDVEDRGGETWKGISRRNWPKWSGWMIIDSAGLKPGFPMNLDNNLELENEVKTFYRANFWEVNRLTEIKDQSIAIELFDTGVNMSTGKAAVFLQDSLNTLNRQGKSYRDIPLDGKIGPVTISLTNTHKDPEALYNILNIYQGARYIEICKKDPSQEKFMYGWLKRAYTRYI